MDKLLIIDGHNLLFQMFFGMPSRIVNKDGKAIHGTLGFVGAMIKIIHMTEPTLRKLLFLLRQGYLFFQPYMDCFYGIKRCRVQRLSCQTSELTFTILYIIMYLVVKPHYD